MTEETIRAIENMKQIFSDLKISDEEVAALVSYPAKPSLSGNDHPEKCNRSKEH